MHQELSQEPFVANSDMSTRSLMMATGMHTLMHKVLKPQGRSNFFSQ
jgi:hypothetical protein